MKYFITGHTGFKGSWLVLLLQHLGHEVAGFSLEPDPKSLFQLGGLEADVAHHFIGDVRDKDSLREAIVEANPDVGLHLAAQPLVIDSYLKPSETFSTNVNGTLNFLEAWTTEAKEKPALIITTDKVYKDSGKRTYSEGDELGGIDPYSASKSMADLLAQSWRHTYPDTQLGIARAGNVIGAFDSAPNRLLPDLLRSHERGEPLVVRNPSAVRPWQHVLDCLNGYLMFLGRITSSGRQTPVAINFGPDSDDFKSVQEVVEFSKSKLPGLRVDSAVSPSGPKETQFLCLDSSKARSELRWAPRYDFFESVTLSLAEREWRQNPRKLVQAQIADFLEAR